MGRHSSVIVVTAIVRHLCLRVLPLRRAAARRCSLVPRVTHAHELGPGERESTQFAILEQLDLHKLLVGQILVSLDSNFLQDRLHMGQTNGLLDHMTLDREVPLVVGLCLVTLFEGTTDRLCRQIYDVHQTISTASHDDRLVSAGDILD